MASSQLEQQIRYEPPPAHLAWLETIAIVLLVPVLGLVFHREDPLFIRSAFPWMMIVPLLAGMRYGFLYGFASALATTVLLYLGWRNLPPPAQSFPYEYALAAAITGMLAGEFADSWMRRLGRLQILLDYRVARQTEFTRSYHLLKISHDQLEERVAGRQFSLRNALLDLKKSLARISGSRDSVLRNNAQRILEFVAVHGEITAAAIYEVRDNREVLATPLTMLGMRQQEAPLDHPMISEALSSTNLVSVRSAAFRDPERHARQPILAVIPLVDVEAHIWGLIVVNSMPFMSYHDDNLDMLAALGGSIGDMLLDSGRDMALQHPSQRASFLAKLHRWSDYAGRYRLRSSLVAIAMSEELSGPRSPWGFDRLIFNQMRTLEEGLVLPNRRGGNSLIVLMPLTDSEGFDGFRRRIISQIERALGRRISDDDLVLRRIELESRADAGELLSRICERSDTELPALPGGPDAAA